MNAIATPCIKVCTLDAAGKVCLGCLRTTEEIAAWGTYSHDERTRMIAELPERHRRREKVAKALEPRQCSKCGAPFGCGSSGPEGACWCNRYPPVAPVEGATCLCPACLAAATT